MCLNFKYFISKFNKTAVFMGTVIQDFAMFDMVLKI